MKKILGLSLMTGMLLVYFIGCGESGGGSSFSALSFPSNAVSSEATIENGVQIKNIVAQDQQSAYSVSNSVSNSNNQNMLMIMKKLNGISKEAINSSSYALNEVKKEVKECDNGGSVSITANVFENGKSGNVNTIFNNCEIENILFNGKIYIIVQTTVNSTTMNMKYITDVTFSSNGANGKILKGSTVDIVSQISNDELSNSEMKINAIIHEGSEISGQKNAVYHMPNKNTLYQTSGKVYINNLASYVDYDTSYDMSKTPFILNGSNITSGEARYNMENGGKVKIVAENNKAKVYIDKDGDGNYELSE